MSHSIHTLTVKQIISRVRQVFPDAPEAYIMSLINDAVNEIGEYSQKSISAKSGNSDITTALTAINTELDEATSICDLINTQVDSALSQAGGYEGIADGQSITSVSALMNSAADKITTAIELANTQFDSAVTQNTAEDVELASSHVNAGNGFLSEAQSRATEVQSYLNELNGRVKYLETYGSVIDNYMKVAQGYSTELQSKLAIAQGYGNEVTLRLNVINTEYSQMEKQQAKLQADYDKGLAYLAR